MSELKRAAPRIAVVDRGQLHEQVTTIATLLDIDVQLLIYETVLEVVGDNGPADLAAIVCSTSTAGPFLRDLLAWSDREELKTPILTCLVAQESETEAIEHAISYQHVHWSEASEARSTLREWLKSTVEVFDLRYFREQHQSAASKLRKLRRRAFLGDTTEAITPIEGPPCGPPLPTHVEEIQALRDARSQFERGLIRAAIRQFGSLKAASSELGISYTSLWRRLK